jgi:DNA repair protein RecN (Recombination protein N)
VFDEVDAGIGGHVADVVGRKLRELGRSFQVLCITHLPQIAACGSAHYAITKRVLAGRTVTAVDRLQRDSRVAEIARMLGSGDPTQAIRAAALELLSRGEQKPKGESESAGRAKAKQSQ